MDIGLWDKAFSRLGEALERGLISMETIDQAAGRVLHLKWELGLFDRPYLSMDGTRTAEYPGEAMPEGRAELPVKQTERGTESVWGLFL